jgi:hypothetical protein
MCQASPGPIATQDIMHVGDQIFLARSCGTSLNKYGFVLTDGSFVSQKQNIEASVNYSSQ